ncbi:MAG: hypothetical protein WC717_03140 [Candidatus Micrarchaeia archaeon]|jgi:hypothetical protein
MGFLKGQGATEYLVLLAVVLIVALVSVALLGFFPGMASDARITQSQSYWRGQARPFAILDSSITAAGVGTFSIQNMEANGPFVITDLYVANGTNSTDVTFAAGETKTIGVGAITSGTAGGLYDLQVNFTYTTPNGITGAKQYGAKNLVGRYT